MRRLAPPPQARWEELVPASDGNPAVRVFFAPIGDKARAYAGRAMVAVRNAASEEVQKELEGAIGPEGRILKALSIEAAEVLATMANTMTRETIRFGILEWEGIGGPEGEDTLPVTPETINWFLADEELLAAADAKYVMPDSLRLAEKNASAASRNGTGVAATQADGTANSPASQDPGSDAAPTPKQAKGKRAPTSSTKPRPKKAKPSGE